MSDRLAVFKSLQHPTRLELLNFLGDHPQDVPYSDLLHFTDESTGKLNYHLRILDDLLVKNDTGYNLSPHGKDVLNWLNSYKQPVIQDNNEFQLPDVIISKIYPDRKLLVKFSIYLIFISVPFFGISALFASLFNTITPVIVVLLGLILGIVVATLYYNSIWYRINETEVEVYKGIFTRSHRIVPFRTMTNLDLKQGIFDQILNISTVEIHTAGTSRHKIGAEEVLMGMVEADEIKETILERIRLLNPINVIPNSSKKRPQVIQGLNELKNELFQLNQELIGMAKKESRA